MIHERTIIKDLAGLITASDHFARDKIGRLFRYQDGVYTSGGEFFVRQRVKHVLLEAHLAERWTRGLAHEVIEFITLDSPELWEQPSPVLINVANGLLDIRNSELLPHSPAFLSSVRIPVRFDPTADCPYTKGFIDEVFPQDSCDLAWEILGDLLTPDRSIQQAICLLGEGGNGKSAFAYLASQFVGPDNVAHLSLQRLEQDRFAVARLYGKLANICADLPNERISDSAIFKAVTGGDRLTGELKYRDSFEFQPFARLLFSANHLPWGRDASQAYFDRWLLVPFEGRFRGTRKEIPRHVLDTRLSHPRELSGALNQVLPALRNLRRRGRFSEAHTTRREADTFRESTDPCAAWLVVETISSPTAFIPQHQLYSAYAQACIAQGRPVITRQMFGRKLKQSRPELEEAQRIVEGKKQWVYVGIALRNGISPSTAFPRPERPVTVLNTSNED